MPEPQHRRPVGIDAPRVIGSTIILIGTAFLYLLMSRRNDGKFIYPLDDAYIHLAVAHNLALHGTWGVVPGHFESASSSPLWTLLLAIPIVGTRGRGEQFFPLVLAAIAALWACHSASRILSSSEKYRSAVTVAAAMLSLLPLVLSGMEHALHVAFLLAALVPFFAVVTRSAARREQILLALLLGGAMLCRFETLFFACGLIVALAVADPSPTGGFVARLFRRWRDVVNVAAPVLAVVVAVAVTNRSLGQGWLPNSILAKASSAGTIPIVSEISGDPRRLITIVVLITVTTVSVIWSARRSSVRSDVAVLAIVTLAATGGQMVFTIWSDQSIYWLRYHAYLYVLVIITAGGAWGPPQPRRPPVVATFAQLAALPILIISIFQLARLPFNSWEIGHQQWQTARFFASHAQGRTVALNDLGAVAYLHRGPILDLAGLGSWQVLRAGHGTPPDRATIDELTRHADVDIAALYVHWFPGGLPQEWVPLEKWCLSTPLPNVVGGRCVTFFATRTGSATYWRHELDEFHRRLPSGVQVERAG